MKLEKFEDNDGNEFLQARGEGWSVCLTPEDREHFCDVEILFDSGGRICLDVGPLDWRDNAVYIINLILQDRFGKGTPWLTA